MSISAKLRKQIMSITTAEAAQIKSEGWFKRVYIIYLTELLDWETRQVRVTKYGKAYQKSGLWGRIRSHATPCPLGKVTAIKLESKEAMVELEAYLDSNLPRLNWLGKDREVTTLTRQEILNMLGL